MANAHAPAHGVLIEAAVDSAADAERAVREGAGRLEVCGDLSVGGVTPSRELLAACLALGVPCVAMARPRGGNFTYDDAEFERICADVSDVLAAGAHGVVFGCLRADHTIPEEDVLALVRLAENAETVFHRAFDDTPDAAAALDTLIACGVSRVLTSGHAQTAIDGVDEIARMVSRAAGRITILPGGSVRAGNARELVARTAVTQLHARASSARVIAEIVAAVTADHGAHG